MKPTIRVQVVVDSVLEDEFILCGREEDDDGWCDSPEELVRIMLKPLGRQALGSEIMGMIERVARRGASDGEEDSDANL